MEEYLKPTKEFIWELYKKGLFVKPNLNALEFIKRQSDIYEPENEHLFSDNIFIYQCYTEDSVVEEALTSYFIYKGIVFMQRWDTCLDKFDYDDCDYSMKDIDMKMELIKNTIPTMKTDDFINYLQGNRNDIIKYDKKTYLMFDSNTSLTKIGKSKDPKIREKTLQGEKPTISLFAICDDNIEDYLHNVFSEYRVRGEWFNLSQNQINTIIEKHAFKIQK